MRKEQGLTMAQVAERFRINVSTVMIWSKSTEPKFKAKLDMEALKRDIQEYPHESLMKRAKRLHVSGTSIWRALKHLTDI